MSYKVFIDGSSGTTGLRISDRLAGRPELELLSIPEESRKDLHKRAETINAADLAFLCLPRRRFQRGAPPGGAPRQGAGHLHRLPHRAGGGYTASPSCTASGKSSGRQTVWRCPGAMRPASSAWRAPWWSWVWRRRTIPSPATA